MFLNSVGAIAWIAPAIHAFRCAGTPAGPILVVLMLLTGAPLPGGYLPEWRESTISSSLKMGYQLVAVDLNRDGRPDLIVVDERGTELAWLENPTWERHVIIKDVPRTINLDVYDYDGDGIPEIAMGYNFETAPEKSIGNVLILKSGPDPRQPWTAKEIDRVPTVHRLRWIDLAGNGRKVLLVAPMIGPNARPPEYADNVPVYLYYIVPASGSANCSRISLAAFSTASFQSTGRAVVSSS